VSGQNTGFSSAQNSRLLETFHSFSFNSVSNEQNASKVRTYILLDLLQLTIASSSIEALLCITTASRLARVHD